MNKTTNISFYNKIVQASGNIVSDMDGDKVMMSIHNGKYYNLGEIGGSIWDLIKSPITTRQLITALMSEYDVDQTECEEQVISFLELLNKEGLIQIEDEI